MNIDKLSDNDILAGMADKQIKPNKISNWVNEPKVSDLKYDLMQAKSSQSAYLTKLKEWVDGYNAPKFGTSKHKGSRINPKLIRKQAEWCSSSLTEPFLATKDLFTINPITHEDVSRAKQNALILNRQFNVHLKKTKLVDNIIRYLVKNGTCIVRTGWEYQEKEVIEDEEQFQYTPIQDEQLLNQYNELARLQVEEPDTYETYDSALKAGFEMSNETGQLLIAQSIGFKKVKKIKPIVNKPTAVICDLANIYIDPTCKGNEDNIQFIIHGFESSLSDLKKANQYTNLDKLEEVLNNEVLNNTDNSFRFADKARRKVTVYEYWGYWDIHGKGMTVPIVATWVGDVMIRLEENPFPDGKPPFVIFNFIPEEDSIYGIPNAELLLDNQQILGAVTRGVIDLLGKSANSQTGYAKNFLDATNKAKFLRGEDYEYNYGTDPRLAVFTHTYPEIPNSAMTTIQFMNNEAESLSGVKAFSGTGISAKGLGDVAVGIRGVLDAVGKREMSFLRRISLGLETLGRKVLSMNSVFLSDEEVVRITNSEFIKVRRDDLAGEFDLEVTVASGEVNDAKAKELAFIMQTMGNNFGSDLMQLILSQIADLRNMPDLAKAIMDYKPEPDELAMKERELQVAMLEAQVQLTQAQAQEAMAKAQVHEAKVDVEHARADNLQSQADNNTLEFIQKDSGIKQAHDLEKQALINDGLNQREQTKADSQLTNQLANQFLNQEMTNDYQQGII